MRHINALLIVHCTERRRGQKSCHPQNRAPSPSTFLRTHCEPRELPFKTLQKLTFTAFCTRFRTSIDEPIYGVLMVRKTTAILSDI